MRMEGAFAEIKPIFAVDENNREIRFASTGGAVDRLHMSDGVVWIVLPPKLLRGNSSQVSESPPLRDGSLVTIFQRTSQRISKPEICKISTQFETVPPREVQQLLEEETWKGLFSFVQRPKFPEDPNMTGSAAVRAKVLSRSEAMLARPDLEAVAEYLTLKKVQEEQHRTQLLMRDVQSRRQQERWRVAERRARRETLEARTGKRGLCSPQSPGALEPGGHGGSMGY